MPETKQLSPPAAAQFSAFLSRFQPTIIEQVPAPQIVGFLVHIKPPNAIENPGPQRMLLGL